MTLASPDVIVIGAGLHGLSAALHLSQAGMRPIVLEKDYPGRHASGVNAGGVRRLGRHFAEVPLSVESLKMWRHIEELVDDDCGFTPCGQIKVAETEAELDSLQRRVDELRALGYGHEVLIGRDGLRERVPAIAPHCVGGVACHGDGSANPFRTVTAFRRKAESLGVKVQSGVAVRHISRTESTWRVSTTGGEFQAPRLVNTAGAWGGKISAMLGEPAPVRADALMLMITERIEPFLSPVLGATGRTLSFKQFSNGTVLIGGGHRGRTQPDTNRTEVQLGGLRISAQTVRALFPQLRNVQVARFWAGIEGVTPDGLPIIGPSATEENAWHAFGFSAHGFQLGPVSGRIIAELITRGESSLPIEPFRLRRFNTAIGATGD